LKTLLDRNKIVMLDEI